VDWDWEDGPPRDAPRRRPEEPSPHPASEPPSFSDAVDRFERPAQAPRDAGPRDDDFSSIGVASERDDLRPRPPADRAAARARRRKQVKQRRLIALIVLAVIVVLLAVLAVRACGGPSEGQAAAASSSPRPAALRTPTAADPLRMAAYGESVGGGALLGIKLLTEQRKDIKVHRFVKVASGLTRPDFFDWPSYLQQDMAKRKRPFEAVLLMLGANDGQDTTVDGKQLAFGSGSWKAMYAKRVGDLMDFYLDKGVKRVYWAGMPRMGSGWFNERMEVLNGVYEDEAAKRAPRVEYVDEWTAVDAPETAYQAKLRQDDGVHLTVDGGMKAAEAAMTAVAEDWHMPPFKAAQ
jgi:lysophospholipase L1-like esterase